MSLNSPNVNVLVAAARKAGRSLARDLGEAQNLQASVKGASAFTEAAERRAEQVLRRELEHARPAYGWLSRARGAEDGRDPTRRWVLAPLDGMANFEHGAPHVAISVALEYKGEVVAAVVLDPAKDELFVAEKGQGAFLNERRLRVSARREIADAMFAAGLPAGLSPNLPQALRDLAHVGPRCAGLRRFGVASLDLAYVAAGRFDGFWDRDLQPWSMAAGLLLAREAGALASDFAGGQEMAERREAVAATPELHSRLLTLLATP